MGKELPIPSELERLAISRRAKAKSKQNMEKLRVIPYIAPNDIYHIDEMQYMESVWEHEKSAVDNWVDKWVDSHGTPEGI